MLAKAARLGSKNAEVEPGVEDTSSASKPCIMYREPASGTTCRRGHSGTRTVVMRPIRGCCRLVGAYGLREGSGGKA